MLCLGGLHLFLHLNDTMVLNLLYLVSVTNTFCSFNKKREGSTQHNMLHLEMANLAEVLIPEGLIP